MSKTARCNCKSGCKNKRCACFKNNEACGNSCSCRNCQNPLNGVDLENLSDCATQNIELLKQLSPQQLEMPLELPCNHTAVPLKNLLVGYACSGCKEIIYWYSFCWDRVVQDSNSWHCEICNQCRDWKMWHCDRCNKCSYGMTLPCENCGPEEVYTKEDIDQLLEEYLQVQKVIKDIQTYEKEIKKCV
ncbi:hypothetical protein QUF58_13505 [Anaerolineales bacterium HSG24]|nr:hypothetical protein [Anaerolineales bacterium HSG24]